MYRSVEVYYRKSVETQDSNQYIQVQLPILSAKKQLMKRWIYYDIYDIENVYVYPNFIKNTENLIYFIDTLEKWRENLISKRYHIFGSYQMKI